MHDGAASSAIGLPTAPGSNGTKANLVVTYQFQGTVELFAMFFFKWNRTVHDWAKQMEWHRYRYVVIYIYMRLFIIIWYYIYSFIFNYYIYINFIIYSYIIYNYIIYNYIYNRHTGLATLKTPNLLGKAGRVIVSARQLQEIWLRRVVASVVHLQWHSARTRSGVAVRDK